MIRCYWYETQTACCTIGVKFSVLSTSDWYSESGVENWLLLFIWINVIDVEIKYNWITEVLTGSIEKINKPGLWVTY